MSSSIEYPQARMADEIERLFARNHTLTIASAYKGLILTHPIHVLDILPYRVIFQAPGPLLCFTTVKPGSYIGPSPNLLIEAGVIRPARPGGSLYGVRQVTVVQ
jgi:hypothetical protein